MTKGPQWKRIATIIQILTEEGLGFVAYRLGWSKEKPTEDAGTPDTEDQDAQPASEEQQAPEADAQEAYARRLCRVLERLGPLFVKFGQILSTREDLLPKAYCEAFAQLQSQVSPFDSQEARELLEEELGAPVEELFASFEEEPLAAASLAQVHGATLEDGSQVVVKIQRPNASQLVLADTQMLLWVSRQMDRFLPFYKARRIHAMAEEFARTAQMELNFQHEATIAARFRANFEDRPDVYVPAMYPELTTGRVLVMERILGHKLDSLKTRAEIEALGIDVEKLVMLLLRTVMTQAYVHGLIHADLHPGNIFLLEGGKLAMIDFGLYGELSRSMQNALFRTVLYRTHFKHVELAEAMLELMEETEDADPAAFRKAIIESNKQLEGASIAERSIAHSIQEEGRIAAEHGYVAPNEIMMLARALITAEGIAIKFAPDMQVAEHLRPIMREITLERFDLERIMQDGLLVLPDILEMIELAPAFHRNLLKVERAFAKSANLSEFVVSQFVGQRPKSRDRRGIGPYILAGILWLVTIAFVTTQPKPIQTFGDLSLLSAVALVGAVVTTFNALQPR